MARNSVPASEVFGAALFFALLVLTLLAVMVVFGPDFTAVAR